MTQFRFSASSGGGLAVLLLDDLEKVECHPVHLPILGSTWLRSQAFIPPLESSRPIGQAS